MKPEEFIAALDRYGADLSRWPEAERQAGEAMLQGGAGASWQDWQAARTLDALLSTPVAPPSRELTDRIMTLPQQVQPARVKLNPGLGWLLSWPRQLTAAMVTASLLGVIWVGMGVSPSFSPLPATPATVSVNEHESSASANDQMFDDMDEDFLFGDL